MTAVAAQLGSNVRVGLEDTLYIAHRQLATSNAEQVTKVRRILEEQGHRIATSDEARAILDLKGSEMVAF